MPEFTRTGGMHKVTYPYLIYTSQLGLPTKKDEDITKKITSRYEELSKIHHRGNNYFKSLSLYNILTCIPFSSVKFQYLKPVRIWISLLALQLFSVIFYFMSFDRVPIIVNFGRAFFLFCISLAVSFGNCLWTSEVEAWITNALY